MLYKGVYLMASQSLRWTSGQVEGSQQLYSYHGVPTKRTYGCWAYFSDCCCFGDEFDQIFVFGSLVEGLILHHWYFFVRSDFPFFADGYTVLARIIYEPESPQSQVHYQNANMRLKSFHENLEHLSTSTLVEKNTLSKINGVECVALQFDWLNKPQ